MAKKYNERKPDLDIFSDLSGIVSEVTSVVPSEIRSAAKQEENTHPIINKLVEMPTKQSPSLGMASNQAGDQVEERKVVTKTKPEVTTLKFDVPTEDYLVLVDMFNKLQQKLGARVNLSHLGRGWITRLITAEKEILDAAEHQGEIKTPNRRDPQEMTEADHAMAVIQSAAFRRAKPIK